MSSSSSSSSSSSHKPYAYITDDATRRMMICSVAIRWDTSKQQTKQGCIAWRLICKCKNKEMSKVVFSAGGATGTVWNICDSAAPSCVQSRWCCSGRRLTLCPERLNLSYGRAKISCLSACPVTFWFAKVNSHLSNSGRAINLMTTLLRFVPTHTVQYSTAGKWRQLDSFNNYCATWCEWMKRCCAQVSGT